MEVVSDSTNQVPAQAELEKHEPETDKTKFDNLGEQRVSLLDNLILNTHKAGMKDLDAGKINEIIQKASEGSLFYQHKQQAQLRLDAKIAEMKSAIDGFTTDQVAAAHKQMERQRMVLSEERDLSRTIVHIDMDMFYAAVEMRDNPKLRDVAMAVGSMSMLSTSNYAARKFGVRAAMPGFIALKLCPELVLVSPNFDKYKAVSKIMGQVLVRYDAHYVMMSLDEAYLDITEHMAANSDAYQHSALPGDTLPERVVAQIREDICQATQLTASAGIAANTRLAKVCSDLNKPDGQYYLPANVDTIMAFVNSLSIRKINGIGNVMEQQLGALGITSCGDVMPHIGLISLVFSEASSSYMLNISLGLGCTDVAAMGAGDRKSMSSETTFAGTSSKQQLFDILTSQCQQLHKELLQANIRGKLITIKIKRVDFVIKSRSLSLGQSTQELQVIVSVSKKLLCQEMEKYSQDNPLTLRLIGVRMSSLCDMANNNKDQQLSITELFAKAAGGEQTHETHSSSDTQQSCGAGLHSTKHTTANNFLCPVCNTLIQTKFLSTFNKHIDSCLGINSKENVTSDLLKETSTSYATDGGTVNSSKVPNVAAANDSEVGYCFSNTSDQYNSDHSIGGDTEYDISSSNASKTTTITVVNNVCNSLAEDNATCDDSTTSSSSSTRCNVISTDDCNSCVNYNTDTCFSNSSVSTSNAGRKDNVSNTNSNSNNNKQISSSSNTKSSANCNTDTTTDDCASKSGGLKEVVMLCPVCCSVEFWCETELNRHLDECLSVEHIRAAKSQAQQQTTMQQKRKQNNNAGTSNGKRHKPPINNTITKYFSGI
uniref:DNA polymerase kappa n=2 Tax=Hirondellea gigas TaxID=1518452 RepID=A0A2P2I8C2_9CRUS